MAVANSAAALGKPVMIRVWILTAARIVVGALDLVGVLFLSQFSSLALSASSVTSSVVPFVRSWKVAPITTLGLALVALSLKSVLSFLLHRSISRLLNSRCAEIIGERALLLAQENKDVLDAQSIAQLHYGLTAGIRAATTGVLSPLSTILAEGSLLLLFGAFLIFANPVAALLSIAILGITSWRLHSYLSSRIYRTGQLSGAAGIASLRKLQDGLRGYRELVVAGRLRHTLAQFGDVEQEVSELQTRQTILGVLPRHVLETVVMLSLGVIAVTSMLYADVTSSILLVTVFGAATARILPSLVPLQSSLAEIQTNLGKADVTSSVSWTVDRSETMTPNRQVTPENPTMLGIKFIDVSYRYPHSSTDVVKNVSFDFTGPGWFAIDGPSGSGKSTILDLMMGIRVPTSGHVRLCGDFEPRTFIQEHPGFCSYLPQRVEIVNGSIAENIAIGHVNREIDMIRVRHLLVTVGLESVVERLRDGVLTHVGEVEANMSGGQLQRLGIARCLYTSPRILLLDESTSGLDPSTQDGVLDVIQSLSRQILVLSISHDSEVSRRASSVIHLRDGELEANQ